jgi:hypothetical protein
MSPLGQSRRMPLRTGVGPLPLFPETGRESEGFDSDALCQTETSPPTRSLAISIVSEVAEKIQIIGS